MNVTAFFDIEVNPDTRQILDIGCLLSDGSVFHSNAIKDFLAFTQHVDFLCGHNVITHDIAYLQKQLGDPGWGLDRAIDTLPLSPLLFPKRPYHHLLKDDKLHSDDKNNPVNDSIKAKDLFFDEVAAFGQLDSVFKTILYALLSEDTRFRNFFKYLQYAPSERGDVASIIREYLHNRICGQCDVAALMASDPVSLAYALTLLNCDDRFSISPPWVLRNYPAVERFLFLLGNAPCVSGCSYCRLALDPLPSLKKHFGFDGFRSYGDQPLQAQAVDAAVHGKSLLAIFPTGGGKSITFQVPALMSGENARALTVVISPLQSLMMDQVDNLEKKDITAAVTINGLLDPIERSKAIERVENGLASLLYISPESLRSITIERLLLKRKIARFVVDEAHCFSSWGQDFRVDYLYIGDFIKTLQEKKNLEYPIPVSCFTATAKQKVIEDILTYFKEKLNLTLQLFRTSTSRTNLAYSVHRNDTEEDKYNQLRGILESQTNASIVYVSRTKKANRLSQKLTDDGFIARPFHGKMKIEEKTENQQAFMAGAVDIIVATSAFGMGVDKSNVGAVVHYDISDSLENYIQEAGRAGRDEKMKANCHILFDEEDLNKHFILLNQTKISSKEINQIWKAIKELTRVRSKVSNSALEIARKAGWDDSIREIETRVKTAIAALEDAGYLKRGQNMPQVFANSILSKHAQEAIDRIYASDKFSDGQKIQAVRIIKKLFSSKSKRLSTEEMAESRVDYISDQLGIVKEEVIRVIELMREVKILADTQDLKAFIKRTDSVNRSLSIVESIRKQEELLLSMMKEEGGVYHLKEINEALLSAGAADSSLHNLKTIFNFWAIKNWIKRQHLALSKNHVQIALLIEKKEFKEKQEKRHLLSRLIVEYLFKQSTEMARTDEKQEEVLVEFSILELKEMIEASQGMFSIKATIDDVEDTLFYLSRIEAVKIEGGFLVAYNKLTIERLEKNNRKQYTESDYERLKQYYEQKVQQIHIVGEYAKKMISNYKEALQFVDDYFGLNYSSFLSKYFPGSRQSEIRRTLTPEKFMKLFGDLSPAQLKIINDAASQHIVVAAGPGSGKTRVLVHKLASLLLTEDVKHEQLLMLTFSRAAATEFKKRLMVLIGNAAHYIEIKTFHAYCFDLLGRVGNLPAAEQIIPTTVGKIRNKEIEASKITKTVLVVDEAQDMNADEYELISCLMEENEDMRVIFVGDDDQNIYEFRGAQAANMQRLIVDKMATKHELVDNYRSSSNIVSFCNSWVSTIEHRLKDFPCFAIQSGNGIIDIVEYINGDIVVPLASAIQQTPLAGSTCVLTTTNKDAQLLVGVLVQLGLKAKLIQTNDGFNLSVLYELRCFTDFVNQHNEGPLIGDDEWAAAKRKWVEHIEKSNKKELALSVVHAFESVNTVRKYKSDWNAFLFESRIEDFERIDSEIIYVSTIHKAKGKEFNNVFLLLKDYYPDKDEKKRLFYVAATRAKFMLTIHYVGNYLRGFSGEHANYQKDDRAYEAPTQIAVDLTLRHVNLGSFGSVQHLISKFVSGTSLSIVPEGLADSHGHLVVKYSQKFSEKLSEQIQMGFRIVEATVNFLVYWKEEKNNRELKIILPHLVLRKG